MTPEKRPSVYLLCCLPLAVLAGCATTQRQLDHSLGHASAHAAAHLCRAFGYADADTRTVCTPYLR